MQSLATKTRIAIGRAAMLGQAWEITPDNLAFFPEISLVFNRIKKSGNTSIILALQDAVQGAEPRLRDDMPEKHSRSIVSIGLVHLIKLRKFQSLVCVRHPVSRALSGFLDIGVSGRVNAFWGQTDTWPATAQGFESFLSELTELEHKRINRHFWRQTDLLFQPPSSFNYIVKLENVVGEMEVVLEGVGLNPEKAQYFAGPHPAELAQLNKVTGSASKAHLVSLRSKKLIEDFYADDFHTFGYD
jgi:hypothetical protein